MMTAYKPRFSGIIVLLPVNLLDFDGVFGVWKWCQEVIWDVDVLEPVIDFDDLGDSVGWVSVITTLVTRVVGH